MRTWFETCFSGVTQCDHCRKINMIILYITASFLVTRCSSLTHPCHTETGKSSDICRQLRDICSEGWASKLIFKPLKGINKEMKLLSDSVTFSFHRSLPALMSAVHKKQCSSMCTLDISTLIYLFIHVTGW